MKDWRIKNNSKRLMIRCLIILCKWNFEVLSPRFSRSLPDLHFPPCLLLPTTLMDSHAEWRATTTTRPTTNKTQRNGIFCNAKVEDSAKQHACIHSFVCCFNIRVNQVTKLNQTFLLVAVSWVLFLMLLQNSTKYHILHARVKTFSIY